jgi:hypothetical protein
MKVNQRSYGGKIFRPKPLLHQEENLLVLASCWGVGDQTQRVVDEIVKYVTAATGDVEVTSPFEYLTCLSNQANYLRIATLLANDYVFRGENRAEYTSGYETLILLKNNNQLTWAHVGGPNVLIRRNKKSLVPLVTKYDLSVEFNNAPEAFPPIPGQLLGLDSTCQIICGDSLIQSGDQLVLSSSSHLSPAFWLESKESSLSLDKVTHWMTQEDPESPFWLATVDI